MTSPRKKAPPPRVTARAASRIGSSRKCPDAIARRCEVDALSLRLANAEELLRGIRDGEVDTVMIAGKQGPRVYSLHGTERSYRILIERMNEGALMLTPDKTILYANRTFAHMVKCPLEQVIGGSFRRYLSPDDRTALRALLRRDNPSGAKLQVMLGSATGAQLPVQISLRRLARIDHGRATIGMVVTDMSAAVRHERMLRALSRRLLNAQETERGRVSLELHDNITQLLCAILVRSQALADRLSSSDPACRGEATTIRKMLGDVAGEVERISRNLRPGVLDHLGLSAVVRDAVAEFTDRTDVPVRLACARLAVSLPADSELTLYRILQEALRNVEKHARASRVDVRLGQTGRFVRLVVRDNGVGFEQGRPTAASEGRGGLGLLGMRERATYAGGTLLIRSVPRRGTDIEARIPLPLPAPEGKPTHL